MQYMQYYSPMLGCFSSRQIRASRSNFWWSDNTNTEITDQRHRSGISLLTLLLIRRVSNQTCCRFSHCDVIAGVSQTTGNQSNQSSRSWSINVTVIVSLSLIFIPDKRSLRHSETGESGFCCLRFDLSVTVTAMQRYLCAHPDSTEAGAAHTQLCWQRTRSVSGLSAVRWDQRHLCISGTLSGNDRSGWF